MGGGPRGENFQKTFCKALNISYRFSRHRCPFSISKLIEHSLTTVLLFKPHVCFTSNVKANNGKTLTHTLTRNFFLMPILLDIYVMIKLSSGSCYQLRLRSPYDFSYEHDSVADNNYKEMRIFLSNASTAM